MTNYERWQTLTSSLESPQVYLDFSFYFAISAALERRVFFGDGPYALYPNVYMLLIGPAGIGKGTALRAANVLLKKCHRVDQAGQPITRPIGRDSVAVPLYFKLPDSVTFEKLIMEFCERYVVKVIKHPSGVGKYSYSAAYFCLEELASLFRREKSEDVARFLLNLYDNEPFEYATKKNGQFLLNNSCLNLLAGTTLDFVRTAERSGMLGEGLFSRMFIIYANEPRRICYDYGTVTPAQETALRELQLHVAKLSELSGRIIETPDVLEYMEAWWQSEAKRLSIYREDKLSDYFSRRKIHVKKITAAIHFSESFDMTIPLETWKKGIDVVRSLEANIIKIARRTGRNLNFIAQEKVLHLLQKAPANTLPIPKIYAELSVDLSYFDIKQILELLVEMKMVVLDGDNLKLVP